MNKDLNAQSTILNIDFGINNKRIKNRFLNSITLQNVFYAFCETGSPWNNHVANHGPDGTDEYLKDVAALKRIVESVPNIRHIPTIPNRERPVIIQNVPPPKILSNLNFWQHGKYVDIAYESQESRYRGQHPYAIAQVLGVDALPKRVSKAEIRQLEARRRALIECIEKIDACIASYVPRVPPPLPARPRYRVKAVCQKITAGQFHA